MRSAAQQATWIPDRISSSFGLSSRYSTADSAERETLAAAAPFIGVFLLLALAAVVQMLLDPELVATIFEHF